MNKEQVPRLTRDQVVEVIRKKALLKGAFSGLAKVTVGTVEPTSPGTGDLWVDTAGPTLKYYNGAAWAGVSV